MQIGRKISCDQKGRFENSASKIVKQGADIPPCLKEQ